METMPTPKVTVQDLIRQLKLKELIPEIDSSGREITVTAVNRPGLQLAGFFHYFSSDRVQIMGNLETAYIRSILDQNDSESRDRLQANYRRLAAAGVPCIIYARGLTPEQDFVDICREEGVPLLVSDYTTTDLAAGIIAWLKRQMAPSIMVHGVFIDVYGEGVLITGESGIGKSEVALELIRRGHRLVADDAVVLRKPTDFLVEGTSAELTRFFLELRGIGIVNVEKMYGVESVRVKKKLDMIIEMVAWTDAAESFDRIGMEIQHQDVLGVPVAKYRVPVKPGRNIAVIVEGAAVNNRARKMGYNAAEELNNRQMHPDEL